MHRFGLYVRIFFFDKYKRKRYLQGVFFSMQTVSASEAYPYPSNTFDYELPNHMPYPAPSTGYFPGGGDGGMPGPPVGFFDDDHHRRHHHHHRGAHLSPTQADLISPGEQENWSQQKVRHNRYPGQHPHTNIFIQPEDTGAEPYSNSLYQTPYDSTQNKISTGKLVNTYTGETFETYENQLPPPNTTKGHLPEFQLKQINPRLLWANGGYNHHNPPPRKKEVPGYVFNPVSARGGATAFGEQTYSGEIRKQQQVITMRDIYNNRDGDQVVEPSLNGERPQNMFGLVPRIRYTPYIAPTNELTRGSYRPNPETQNADLRCREEHTGAHFSRKDPLLVRDRAMYPTTFVNGVEAITLAPITSDHIGSQRAGQPQSYVGGPHMDSQMNVHQALPLNKLREGGERTERLASGPSAPAMGQAVGQALPLNKVREDVERTERLASGPSAPAMGQAVGQALPLNKAREGVERTERLASGPSAPAIGQVVGQALPLNKAREGVERTERLASGPNAPAMGQAVGQALPLNKARVGVESNERLVSGPSVPAMGQPVGQALPLNRAREGVERTERLASGPTAPGVGASLIMPAQTRRCTQTGGQTQPLPALDFLNTSGLIIFPTQSDPRVGKRTLSSARTPGDLRHIGKVGIVMDHLNVRQTQKLTAALPTRAVDPGFGSGDVITNQHTLRGTQKKARTLPIGSVGDVRVGVIVADRSVKDTLKTASMENPFRIGNSSTGQRFGETLAQLQTLRPSGRESIAHPVGVAHRPGDPSGHVLVDRNLRHTWAAAQPFASYMPGLSNAVQGQALGPGEVSSAQHRGQCEQRYVPSVSRVPEGVDGFTRIQSLPRVAKCELNDTRALTKNVVVAAPGASRLPFRNLRPTARADVEGTDACEPEVDDL